MAFATRKAILFGSVLAAGMAVAFYALKSPFHYGYVIQAVVTGIVAGAAWGWLMRTITVELPGQSVEQIESALGSSIQLAGLKRSNGPGSEVRFERKGFSDDRLVVQPTATGVTITGPANLIRVIRRKASV